MRRLGLLLAILAFATPAFAQRGYGTMQPYRPDTGSPGTRAGSYANPYVVQDQNGRQTGTVYSARPGGNTAASRPGGYANPYEFHPDRNYRPR